jgi:hypothetical protein
MKNPFCWDMMPYRYTGEKGDWDLKKGRLFKEND